MRAVPDEPNVTLRLTADGEGQEVVLAFPYDGHLVAAVRTLPAADRLGSQGVVGTGRRLGGREALRDPASRPELRRTREFDDWLAAAEQYWVGYVRTTRHDGRGWFVLDTLAGTPPAALRQGAIEEGGRWLVPLIPMQLRPSPNCATRRLSVGARRCAEALEYGEQPPAARLILTRSVAGERFTLETFWDPESRPRSNSCRERPATRSSSTPGSSTSSTRSSRCTRSRSRRRSRGPGALAEQAPRGAAGGRGLACDHRRAAARGRRPARRRARAIPMGRCPLRARGAPHIPLR